MTPLLSSPRLPGTITLLASGLLLLSPLALGFAGPGATSAYVLGALGVVAAVKAFARPAAWDGWLLGAVGLLVAAMPWLAGFEGALAALWSHLLLGLAILAAGLWALWAGRDAAEDVRPGEVPTFRHRDDAGVGP